MDRSYKRYRIFPAGAPVSQPQYDVCSVPALTPADTVLPDVLNLGGRVEYGFCPEALAHLDNGARVLREFPNLIYVDDAERLYAGWFCEAIEINLQAIQTPRLEGAAHV